MAGLAGCSGLLGSDGMPAETLTPVDVSPTATPTETPTQPGGAGESCDTIEGEYSTDGPAVNDLPSPDDRFETLGCPTFEWAAKTVCYQRANLRREAVVLITEVERALVPADGSGGETVSFALVSRRARPVRIQPAAWSILQQRPDGQRWESVASGTPGCTRTVHSEGFHRWYVGIDETVLAPAVNATAVRASLSPGVYLFVVPVFRPGADDFVCAAPFEVAEFQPVTDTPTPTPGAATPGDGDEAPLRNVTDDSTDTA